MYDQDPFDNNMEEKVGFWDLHRLRANPIFGIIALLILAFLFYGVGQVPLLIWYVINGGDLFSLQENPGALYEIIGDSAINIAFITMPFVVALVAVWLTVKYIHKSTFISLITPFKKLNISIFIKTFLLWLFFLAANTLVEVYFMGTNYLFSFDLMDFVPLFLLGLVFLFFQTGFEEIIFRGYLNQYLNRSMNNKWAVAVVSSICFALPHIGNPEVGEYGIGIMMLNYATIGFLLSALVIFQDGLESAWGFHFANNFFICCFANQEGSAIPTRSLFHFPKSDPVNAYVFLLVFGLLFFLIWRVFILKKDRTYISSNL